MSLLKIEYPTYEATRTGAFMAHGEHNEVVEKINPETGSTIFFKVIRNEDRLGATNELRVVGVWSPDKNFGIVYDTAL